LQLVAGQRQALVPCRGQCRETPPEIVATLIAILTKALKAPEMEAAYGGQPSGGAVGRVLVIKR
jgi:hypothetical protein